MDSTPADEIAMMAGSIQKRRVHELSVSSAEFPLVLCLGSGWKWGGYRWIRVDDRFGGVKEMDMGIKGLGL